MLKKIALPWTTIYTANDTGKDFLPATPWMQASEFQSFRVTYELRARLGNLRVEPAYQVADVEDTPGTVTAAGSSTTTDGMVYPNAWATPTLKQVDSQALRLAHCYSVDLAHLVPVPHRPWPIQPVKLRQVSLTYWSFHRFSKRTSPNQKGSIHVPRHPIHRILMTQTHFMPSSKATLDHPSK